MYYDRPVMDPETRALLLQKLPAEMVGEVNRHLENAYRAEHKEKMRGALDKISTCNVLYLYTSLNPRVIEFPQNEYERIRKGVLDDMEFLLFHHTYTVWNKQNLLQEARERRSHNIKVIKRPRRYKGRFRITIFLPDLAILDAYTQLKLLSLYTE